MRNRQYRERPDPLKTLRRGLGIGKILEILGNNNKKFIELLVNLDKKINPIFKRQRICDILINEIKQQK